jgi:hypothetical protein
LPVNFESASSVTEFLQASEAATVKKLFLEKGLPIDDIVDRNQRPPYVKNKSYDWVTPTLFISAALYSENPALVSMALSVLANYATDFFKGINRMPDVRLDIVAEETKTKTYKKISYQGPVDGLKNLADVIRAVIK